MPYKYVVSVDSKGFDEATDDVLRALGRLSWATETAVISAGGVYQPPNELLILGYFAEMSIGVSAAQHMFLMFCLTLASFMTTAKNHSAQRLPLCLWAQTRTCESA